MSDLIFSAFIERQGQEATKLASESDLVHVLPLAPFPATRFIVEFSCKGLIRSGGRVAEANEFAVGIRFGPSYLRTPVNVGELLMWIHPKGIFHPNIAPPYICIGDVRPGTGLLELLYRVFELITWGKFMPREDDALSHAACVWARHHMERFPVDRRPLKWRGR